MKNVVFVDFQAKRHEREEGFLIWRDMVERRARLFSEIRENDGQVVTPWDAINLATRKRGPPC
jgi:hypothetical protein